MGNEQITIYIKYVDISRQAPFQIDHFFNPMLYYHGALVKKPELGTSIGLVLKNKQHPSQHHSMAGVTLHNLVGTIYYAYALA